MKSWGTLFIYFLLLLVLSSCSWNETVSFKQSLNDAHKSIRSNEYEEAALILEKLLPHGYDASYNDSLALVHTLLSEIAYVSDSLNLWTQHLKEAARYYQENRNNTQLLETKLRSAKYYLGCLMPKEAKQILDEIKEGNASTNNTQERVKLAILEDQLFYQTYGYYTDSLLQPMLPDLGPANAAVQIEFKLQHVKHDIFNWNFNEARRKLAALDSLIAPLDSLPIQAALALTHATLHYELSEHLTVDSILTNLESQLKNKLSSKQQYQLWYLSAANSKKRDHFLATDSLLNLLKSDHYEAIGKRKQFEIDFLESSSLLGMGDYNGCNKLLSELLKKYDLTSFPFQNLKFKLQGADILTWKRQFNDADEQFNLLANKADSLGYQRLHLSILLSKSGNAITSASFDHAINILHEIDKRNRSASDYRVLYYQNNYLGRSQTKLGDSIKAIESFQISFDFAIQENYKFGRAVTNNFLSLAAKQRNDDQSYLEYNKAAIELFKELGNDRQLGNLYYNIGAFYKRKDSIKLANKYLLKSLHYKEIIRGTAKDEQRRILLNKEIGLYCGIQRNYQLLGDNEGCVRIGERSKAKWIEEVLGIDQHIGELPSLNEIQYSLQKNECVLQYYNHLYSKTFAILITKDIVQVERLDNFKLVDNLLQQHDFTYYLNKTLSKKDSSIIQQWKAGKSWQDYSIAKIVFRTFISYQRDLMQISFPTSDDEERFKDASKLMYQFLLAPFEANINGVTSMKVIPDGYLGYLPFEALMDSNNHYLVEHYDVSYVQSLRVWNFLKQRSKKQKKQKVGYIAYRQFEFNNEHAAENTTEYSWQNLDGYFAEKAYMQERFPRITIYPNETTSKDQILELAAKGDFEKYKILHISTHAHFVPGAPDQTSLVIPNTEEQRLEHLSFNDITQLDINADFVTLAACETGIGESFSGEGITGLSQAFVVAGANGLLSTMWQVPDDYTNVFMKEFYDGLNKDEVNYSAAINELKRKLIRGEYKNIMQNPYYWAGYTYYGK